MTDETVLLNLSADRPIHSLDQDLLDRGDFTIALANAIRAWRNPDSLVLAIYGPWGHGKTSVKNMVLSLLRKAADRPAIIEFNPWNWSGEDRIQAAFFEEIEIAIGNMAKTSDREALSRKWRKYAIRLNLGVTALENLKSVAELAGIPWAPSILSSLSNVATKSAEFTESTAEAYSSDDMSEQSFEQLKQSLHDHLAKLSAPILVVMDDIDRLTKEEIRLLFRLVKVNADFPNMIYLLLFEREPVEAALSEVVNGDGRAYMEKVVQAGFDLPTVHQPDIDHALTMGLASLFQYEGVSQRFDTDRWQNFYADCLQPFFRSLRDVRRFLSTFSFELGLFYKEKTLDINFIDLIGLEVLRVFEPAVYQGLPDAKDLLVKTPMGHLLGEDSKENTLQRLDELVARARQDRREIAKELITSLFPKIEWARKGYGYGVGFEDRWQQSLRVCHHRMFDRYFIMSLPKGEVPLSMLQQLMAGKTRNEFVAHFQQLHDRGWLNAAIQRLDAYKHSLDQSRVEPFVTALFDSENLLQINEGGPFVLSTDMMACRIIHHYLMQDEDRTARSQKLLRCLKNTKGLWLPVRVVALEERDDDEHGLDRSVFDEQGLSEAKAVCLDKIRKTDLHALEGPKLTLCLWRWREWADEKEAREWAAKVGTSISGAVRLIGAFATPVHVTSGSGSRVVYQLKLEHLEKFVDAKQLEATLEPVLTGKNIPKDCATLAEEFANEIGAFQNALNRRVAGKPDDWRYDEEL